MQSSHDTTTRLPRSSSPLRRLTLPTLVTLAILAARIVLYTGQYAGPSSLRPAFEIAGAAHVWLLGIGIALGLVWLYRAWARIPEESRRTYDGRKVSPDEALTRLFIPLYNLYWIFITNVGLCGAIETHARRRGKPTRAPSSLAMTACIVQVIPLVGLLVAPLVWSAFMVRIDLLQSAIEE